MTSYRDRLDALVAARGPLCVGIDPHPGLLAQWGLDADVNGLERFARSVVEALVGQVAIFNGVSQQVGPISLSHLDHETDIPLDRLPAYAQDRVRQGMPARDLGHADQIVGELQETAGAPVDGGGTP